jgi:CheY-like chemotaxis protein
MREKIWGFWAIDSMCDGGNFPLILLDVLMPKGIDGFETCRRLKQDESTAAIPVIFVTAKGEMESVIQGFRVGGVDYITKPFEKEEVLIRIQTHLKISRLTNEVIQKNSELQQEIDRCEQAENALQKADEQLSVISTREAERWGIAGFVGQSHTISKILRWFTAGLQPKCWSNLVTKIYHSQVSIATFLNRRRSLCPVQKSAF